LKQADALHKTIKGKPLIQVSEDTLGADDAKDHIFLAGVSESSWVEEEGLPPASKCSEKMVPPPPMRLSLKNLTLIRYC